MKKRRFPRTNGGADRIPNLVVTEADAHNIAKSKPASIVFITAKVRLEVM